MESVGQEIWRVARRKRDGELIVFEERAAASRQSVRRNVACVVVGDGDYVEATLRIRRVNVMRSQQSVTLRSHITELKDHISSQFLLEIQVVLSRILRAHVRLEIPVQQHGAEGSPILRRAGRRAQYSIKGIGADGAALRNEGSVQKSCRQEGAAPERWFGAELFQNKLLHRVVEQAPTAADGGLGIGAVGQPDAWRKGFVVSLRESRRDAGVSWNNQPRRLDSRRGACAGPESGLLAGG
jgi:hypothetical protein